MAKLTVAERFRAEGAMNALEVAGERIRELEAELAQWRTWGVIEVAVRNPQVAEYMQHWEGRADRAEARLDRLTHPKVYEGTHYSAAEIPELCPECDGRNWISHGLKGMVCMNCWLTAELDKAEEQVRRLSGPVCEWTPITAENLPKVGDEVGGWDEGGTEFWRVRHASEGMCNLRNKNPQDRDWERLGYTHFRAINPPALAARAGEGEKS